MEKHNQVQKTIENKIFTPIALTKPGYIYNGDILKKVEIRGTLGSGQKNIVATKVMINGKTVKKYKKENVITVNGYEYYDWYLIK